MIWSLWSSQPDDDDDDEVYVDPEAANEAAKWDYNNFSDQDSTHTGLDEADGDALNDAGGGLFDWIYKL